MSFLLELKNCSQMYHEIVEACHHILKHDEIAEFARSHLKTRVPESLWKELGFGFFPDDDNLKQIFSLLKKEMLEKIGVIYPKFPIGIKGHFSEHNLLMPFKDAHGNVVALVGRSLLSEESRKELQLQKYKYNKGARKSLYVYGLDNAKNAIIKKNKVVCVEGQFDCIACRMRGIDNVIAFGGADMSPYQFFQIHRYTNNFVLIMDNDEAGLKAKKRLKKNYKEFANIVSVQPPKGYKDLEEFWRRENDQNWCNAVADQLKNL